jgi:hypothetical protein
MREKKKLTDRREESDMEKREGTRDRWRELKRGSEKEKRWS